MHLTLPTRRLYFVLVVVVIVVGFVAIVALHKLHFVSAIAPTHTSTVESIIGPLWQKKIIRF